MLYGYPMVKKLCGGLQASLGARTVCCARCPHMLHPGLGRPRPPPKLPVKRCSVIRRCPWHLSAALPSLPPAPQAFMEQHNFKTLDDFRGASLPYFTTHHELVRDVRRPAACAPEGWHCSRQHRSAQGSAAAWQAG